MEIRNSKVEIRNKSQRGKGKTPNSSPHRVWQFLPFLRLICFAFRTSHFGFAASPASRPTDQIPAWFSNLAHHDSAVRDEARIGLMGISRDDLQSIKKLIEQNRPPRLAIGAESCLEELLREQNDEADRALSAPNLK